MIAFLTETDFRMVLLSGDGGVIGRENGDDRGSPVQIICVGSSMDVQAASIAVMPRV
jgi:hypothetical protein